MITATGTVRRAVPRPLRNWLRAPVRQTTDWLLELASNGGYSVDCTVRDGIICDGCELDQCTIEQSVIGIRTRVQPGTRISRSVLLGADFYETDDLAFAHTRGPRLGIGRDVVLDRVIVDKNARIGDGVRLTNAAGIQHQDGDGYYIRNGIIVVPKDGVIKAGTTV